jgi:hypothetical protein
VPSLHDYLGKHTGQTAWIFGKGPSLDAFDMASAGPLRCAINDVAAYVPGCVYTFANDSVAKWAHVYQPGHTLFQPLRLQHDIHAAHVPVPCPRIWFADEADADRLTWPRERLAAEGLAIRHGTLGSAGQILHLMGVKRIIAVGIDGGGTHAAKPWLTRLRHDHARDYNTIRDNFIEACALQGIELEFFGQPDEPALNPNGTMQVKILRACFVAGKPQPAGAIVDFPPALAQELITIGRATRWTEPAQPAAPVIETAEAAPAAEKAVAPSADPKGKKNKK